MNVTVRRRGRFRLGDTLVEPERNLLTGPGGGVALEPKIMDVLCVLAARPGEVVSRDELIEEVWGVEFGADESLTRAISQLRKAFGEKPGEARVLETIPKRGYRLATPVLSAEPGLAPEMSASARTARPRLALLAAGLVLLVSVAVGWALLRGPLASGPPAPTGLSVTVAGFSTPTDDPRLAAFADGVRSELTTALARSSLLLVMAVDGAHAPRQVRDPAYLVVGGMKAAGGRLRMTVELVEPSDGRRLWGAAYEEPLAGDPAASGRLASRLAADLYSPLRQAAKAELKRRPIMSLSPWQLTLLATWVPGTDGVFLAPHTSDAFWLQRRALRLDPDYAPAHATLANALAYHALFDPAADTSGALGEAERHAQVAAAKAPYDGEVLYELARYQQFAGRREGAAQALRRVLVLQPQHPMAPVDLAFVEGHCSDQGGAAIAQLRDLDGRLSPESPVRWVVLSHIADLHLARGEFEQARAAAAQSRQIVKQTWTGVTLAAALAALGREAEAARVAGEVRLEWPGLDFNRFAERTLPRWCLGGTHTGPARAAFLRLAAAERKG